MPTREITEVSRSRQIEAILSHFDFDKVKKTVDALYWEWDTLEDVPSMADLKMHGRLLLSRVSLNNTPLIVNGFEATIKHNNCLSLKFIVSSWNGRCSFSKDIAFLEK
jgi:hypothetical protein